MAWSRVKRVNTQGSPASPEEEWHSNIENKLSMGQRKLRRIRHSLAGTMLSAGCISMCFYMRLKRSCISACTWDPQGSSWSWRCFFEDLSLSFLYWLRYLCFGLAPLADDLCLTRLVLLFDAVITVADNAQDFWMCPRWETDVLINLLGNSAVSLFVLISIAWLLCNPRTAEVQRRLWTVIYVMAVLQLLSLVLFFIFYECLEGSTGGTIPWSIANVLFLLLIGQRHWRDTLHNWLSFAVTRRSKEAAAAGIAGLVGECGPHEVVAQADACFRGVVLSDLSFYAVTGNTPDPSLYDLSRPVPVRGHCDAFVSHSWHDDPAAKWEMLQAWRQAFITARGREPVVWFDRCCINQANIEADLRCLPIFLNRCDEMLMLTGITYLSRLWCVVEVFTFVHVGGDFEHLRIQPVLRAGNEVADRTVIERQFASFDAELCVCFDQRDKDKMLTIIQAAFGTLQLFNTAVMGIFSQLDGHPSSSSSSESTDSGDPG